VDEWAEKRGARAEKAAKPKEAPDPVAQEKRAAKRDDRIAEGLQDCAKWLKDAVHQGFSHGSLAQPKHWETFAARMADAQAPGIRKRLIELGRIVNSGPGWPERLLEGAAEIYLVGEAFARLDQLPEAVRADVRSVIGVPVRKEDLLPPVSDFWLVAGQRNWEDEKITVQRSWLYGFGSKKWAMVLAFAAAGQGFDPPLVTGSAFHADVAFYPSAWPLRASLVNRTDSPTALPPEGTIREMLESFSAALSQNPWIEAFPLALHQTTLASCEGKWLVVDSEGAVLPLHDSARVWNMLAISGGKPVSILGEWDGESFRPLTMMSDKRYRRL
jgi:hypothetical protein